MERSVWTDPRIDDRMSAIDKSFDRQFAELRESRLANRADAAALRQEMAALRTSVSSDIEGLRTSLTSEIGELRADLVAFQRQVTGIVAGFATGLLGVLAAALLTRL